jgi:hypothetical protein
MIMIIRYYNFLNILIIYVFLFYKELFEIAHSLVKQYPQDAVIIIIKIFLYQISLTNFKINSLRFRGSQ